MAWISSKLASVNTPLGSKRTFSKNSKLDWRDALLKENTYERELFGEENINGSILYGALEKASRGILLIDEVSEIPLETQAKILRVLIDQKFKRINGDHDINVDVRIICSSSKDIKNEIRSGNLGKIYFID